MDWQSQASEPIDPRALRVWTITGIVEAVSTLAIAAVLAGLTARCLPWLAKPAWIGFMAVALVSAWVSACVVPGIRWRRWRYRVAEREIDLVYGVWVVKRTLIPMTRVQHVGTRQGPLLRRYGLASVHIATAAGHHEIPALALNTAETLRTRIAEWAGVADDV
jgi:membrane protein YdbS with pleckstrin-like domain